MLLVTSSLTRRPRFATTAGSKSGSSSPIACLARGTASGRPSRRTTRSISGSAGGTRAPVGRCRRAAVRRRWPFGQFAHVLVYPAVRARRKRGYQLGLRDDLLQRIGVGQAVGVEHERVAFRSSRSRRSDQGRAPRPAAFRVGRSPGRLLRLQPSGSGCPPFERGAHTPTGAIRLRRARRPSRTRCGRSAAASRR